MSKGEEVIILRGKYEGCQAWVNRSKKQPPKNIHLIIMYDVNGDGELVEHQTHLSRRSIEYKKEMDEKETSMDKVQFMAVGSQPKIRMAMRKLVDEIAQTRNFSRRCWRMQSRSITAKGCALKDTAIL